MWPKQMRSASACSASLAEMRLGAVEHQVLVDAARRGVDQQHAHALGLEADLVAQAGEVGVLVVREAASV